MNRRFRLKKTTDIKRVRHSGEAYAHPLVVLLVAPNNLSHSRFGIIAGRSVGKAFQRNRAKRLIRAALQSSLPTIDRGWDVLLIARQHIAGANFKATHAAVHKLMKKAGLILNSDGN